MCSEPGSSGGRAPDNSNPSYTGSRELCAELASRALQDPARRHGTRLQKHERSKAATAKRLLFVHETQGEAVLERSRSALKPSESSLGQASAAAAQGRDELTLPGLASFAFPRRRWRHPDLQPPRTANKSRKGEAIASPPEAPVQPSIVVCNAQILCQRCNIIN